MVRLGVANPIQNVNLTDFKSARLIRFESEFDPTKRVTI